MGAGLTTPAQLEAFRRSSGVPLAKSMRSLWVTATLNPAWLETVDFKPHLSSLTPLEIGDLDRQQAGDRLRSIKKLEALPQSLSKDAGAKDGLKRYLQALRDTIIEAHDARAQTLVIVNRVDRAQGLFRLLREKRPDNKTDLLIHARFRAAERAEQIQIGRAHV